MDFDDVCKQILVAVVVLMFLLRLGNSFADPATLVSLLFSVLRIHFVLLRGCTLWV